MREFVRIQAGQCGEQVGSCAVGSCAACSDCDTHSTISTELPPSLNEQEADHWMLLDKRATVALRAAELMIQESRKEEEKQAQAESVTMMRKALSMYQQAGGYLIDCHADVEGELREMRQRVKRTVRSTRKGFREHQEDLHNIHMIQGFRDHQEQKIEAVGEQILRIDAKLVETLNSAVEQGSDGDPELGG